MSGRILFHVICMLILECFSGCYQDPERDNPYDPHEWQVVYPDAGAYGENLLREGTLAVVPGNFYSLNFVKKGYAKHVVRIPKSNSAMMWTFSVMTDPVIEWVVTIDGSYRLFIADHPATYDCKIQITGPANGDCRIEIYVDNEQSPSRTIALEW